MNTSLQSWVAELGGRKTAADLLGVTQNAVDKWISGDRIPKRQMAAKIERLSGGRVSRMSLLYPEESHGRAA